MHPSSHPSSSSHKSRLALRKVFCSLALAFLPLGACAMPAEQAADGADIHFAEEIGFELL